MDTPETGCPKCGAHGNMKKLTDWPSGRAVFLVECSGCTLRSQMAFNAATAASIWDKRIGVEAWNLRGVNTDILVVPEEPL